MNKRRYPFGGIGIGNGTGSLPANQFVIDSDWMTSKEAAEYLRTSPGGIRNLVWRGHLTRYKLRGRLRFRRSELDQLIEQPRR